MDLLNSYTHIGFIKILEFVKNRFAKERPVKLRMGAASEVCEDNAMPLVRDGGGYAIVCRVNVEIYLHIM